MNIVNGLILHGACVREHSFSIWGERPGDAAPAVPGSALPFGANAEALRRGLQELEVGVDPGKLANETLFAWLPSVGAQPFASHPAIARTPTGIGRPELAAFAVEALTLPFRATIELCARLLDRPAQNGGVTLGEDLLAWIHAFRLAASLVIRQRFVPGVATTAPGSEPRSRWHPRLEGADAETLAAIAKTLPPVARALAVDATAPFRPDDPTAVVRRFVVDAVDTIVRAGAAEALGPGGAAPGYSHPDRRHRSAHDEWIASLADRDARLRMSADVAQELAASIETWHRPLTLGESAPVRVVFRLEEPAAPTDEEATTRSHRDAGANERWQLCTLLRSAEDPSLVLPLNEAIEARGAKARLLAPRGIDLREHALVALAQAAAVSPLVARGLSRGIQERVRLTLDEAHEFLTAHAPALEQAGFAVQLPTWWTGAAARPRVTARARASVPSGAPPGTIHLDSLVEVDWKAALGDQELPLAELKMLARMKAPLVRLRGRWMELDAKQLRAAIDFFESGKSESRSVRELLAMKLGVVPTIEVFGTSARPVTPAPLAISGVDGDGAVGELLSRIDASATFREQPQPDGFAGTLRPYQRRGYSWLKFLRDWRLGACLADDMGLGKTVQTLALLQLERNGAERRPVLLVCPTSVVGNWQREAARFTPELAVLVHHGGERASTGEFEEAAARHALVITSYALLHREVELFAQVGWAGVILDEAQNIKNPQTKQAQAARALKSEWRIALTGTPVENHVGDLWSIMEFLNPGLLGAQEGFRREFLRPIHLGGDPEVGARLKRRTGPFLLRRLKSDPAIAPELPEKLEHDVVCNLTREQASLYAAVVDAAQEGIAAATGIERRGRVLALLTRLKQVCNHPVQYLADGSSLEGRSGKLERLVEMLEEVCDEGDRSLVFTQFREMGDLLERALRERLGREVLFLHGGTPRTRREQLVSQFQEGEGAAIFLLSLKAGGTGLNLTRANHVFHFDRWWNPAVEDQATDRAHRIGQKRRVQVHKLVCAGTLEERIDALIRRKRGIAEHVIGTGESWLTELSTDQLRELVALGEDAVSE